MEYSVSDGNEGQLLLFKERHVLHAALLPYEKLKMVHFDGVE